MKIRRRRRRQALMMMRTMKIGRRRRSRLYWLLTRPRKSRQTSQRLTGYLHESYNAQHLKKTILRLVDKKLQEAPVPLHGVKPKQQEPVAVAKPKIIFRKRDIVEVPRE